MLGRNPMRFNKRRLPKNRGLFNDFFDRQIGTGIFIAIACLICATGCSRLGSNGPLSQRKIPFPPQPLRQASSPTVTAEKVKTTEPVKTARDLRTVENTNLASEVRSETNPARDTVQNLKSRPPKLSQLPRATLYAEPVIDEAKQVAFQEKVNDFEPAARPPAQIFSQPLAKTEDKQFFDPRPAVPAVRPEKFVAPDPQPNDSQTGMLNPIRPSNSTPSESQRIMLVTDTSSSPVEVASAITNASEPTTPTPLTKAIVSQVPLDRQVLNNLPPALLPAEIPLIIEKTPEEVNNGPKVDANLQGEVYLKSVEPQPVQERPREQQSLVAKISPEKEAITPVINEDFPKIQEIEAGDFQKNFSPVEALPQTVAPESDFKPEPINGIEIDPTLGAQRESRLNFSPPNKIDHPQPEPVVFESEKAPVLALPPVKEPLPEVVDTSVAQIEQPAFVPDLKGDINLPVKKCATCDHPDCDGCNIPSDNQFSDAAPMIHGRRSLAPIPVEYPNDQIEIAKKNFGQVSFAPIGLPLPPAVAPSAENIVAAFNQPLPEKEFVNTDAQSDIPPVGVEEVLKLNEITWRSRLQQTISLVKGQLDSDIDSQTRTSLEINLRLLDVLSRQMGDIAQEERALTPSENDFWQHQLEAITSMLQTPESTDEKGHDLMKHHTAHDTLVHLRQAIAELESLANLKVESPSRAVRCHRQWRFSETPLRHTLS